MTVARVEVVGMKNLLRNVRRVETELPKQMRQHLLPISQTVLSRAKQRGQAFGGVQRHAVRRGLRAGATQSTAWIRLGANREPTILGAEFGGGRRKTTRQFPPWRGSGSGAGYFVYPIIRESAGDISNDIERAIDSLLRQAGFR